MFAGRSLQLKAAHRVPGAQHLSLNRPGCVARLPRHLGIAKAEALQPHQSLLARRQALELPESLVRDRKLLRVRRG
jgi:hypothetical protein